MAKKYNKRSTSLDRAMLDMDSALGNVHDRNFVAKAEKKLKELNNLAGYERFTKNDRWTGDHDCGIWDNEAGNTYYIGSIIGDMVISKIINDLKRQNGVKSSRKANIATNASRTFIRRGIFSGIRHDDFYEKPELEDLEHYGVLGMKWGVKRNPERAYTKAMNKLNKLDTKALKSGARSAMLNQRTVDRLQKASTAKIFKKRASGKVAKTVRKSSKAYLKAQKRVQKAKKWYDAMEDAFKDVELKSLKPANSELGKKYANMMIDNEAINARLADMTQLETYYSKKSR